MKNAMHTVNRRHIIVAAAGGHLLLANAQQTDAVSSLQSGQCAVLLRHALTDPGVGDPPGFDINQCATQRNLSPEGRAQAAQIGRWFQTRNLKPAAVRSSPWCRCVDTAQIAFGGSRIQAALGSTFGAQGGRDSPERSAALGALLKAIPAGQFEVWVTHQVNISALTGKSAAMGEAVLMGRDGRVIGEMAFV